MYRIYCDGREFGIDYPTLIDAQRVKRVYQRHFPRCRYCIRKIPDSA